MYKILSIDGGGIRGIIPVRLLERLERHHPGFVQEFDLFAGTSSGAVSAAGFAYGLKARFLRQMFKGFGEVVFADSIWDDLKDLKMLIGADYSLENLKTLLERVVGSITLGELSKKLLITTFDLKAENVYPPRWKPKFFHNYESSNGDMDQKLVDVVLSSVAAPAYFPTYRRYIDGGVSANNPSTCSLAQAYHEGYRDIRLLSLGSGINPKFVDGHDADWGLFQWGLSLVNIFMEGANEVADYQCKQILRDDYFRVQPLLPFPVSLDEWQFTDELIAIADLVNLDPLLDWIDDRFKKQ